MRTLTLIFATSLWTMPFSLAQQQLPSAHPEPKVEYSVCEVLKRNNGVGGEPVRILGVLDGSPFHGYVLKENSLTEPCIASPAEFQSAPAALLLDWTGGYGISLTDAERRGNQATLSHLMDRYKKREVAPIPFIVVGRLVFKQPLLINRSPDGSYKGNGFGEMGAFPAVLVVQAATAK